MPSSRESTFRIHHLTSLNNAIISRSMTEDENQRSTRERAPTLNIPAGNSPITPDSNQPASKDEKLSGNWLQDVWTATKVKSRLMIGKTADALRQSSL